MRAFQTTKAHNNRAHILLPVDASFAPLPPLSDCHRGGPVAKVRDAEALFKDLPAFPDLTIKARRGRLDASANVKYLKAFKKNHRRGGKSFPSHIFIDFRI